MTSRTRQAGNESSSVGGAAEPEPLRGSCAARGDVGPAKKKGAAHESRRTLSDLIYNSVTTLLVGEKIMVEAPTYLFPSGAGVSGVSLPIASTVANHGEPDPMATFRFAEPVTIDPQQNFRSRSCSSRRAFRAMLYL